MSKSTTSLKQLITDVGYVEVIYFWLEYDLYVHFYPYENGRLVDNSRKLLTIDRFEQKHIADVSKFIYDCSNGNKLCVLDSPIIDLLKDIADKLEIP